MVGYRSRFRMRPVNRIKHVVDFQTAVPVNVQITQALAIAKDNPLQSIASDVVVGSTISSIYVTTEVVASETSTTATANFYWLLAKNPGDNLTLPNANNVGVNDNKKFILHQEMVMINPTDGGNPRNVFKGVLKIPPRYRRMGPGDRLVLQLFIPSTGVAVNACTQCHYKEFR